MTKTISRSRREVSELLHIAPISRGQAAGARVPISYADRLKLVLDAFNRREDEGFPSVIRLFEGIHTAQWSLIDGDTRLVLSVVFDGDFNDYMRALSREVPVMLSLIWSNCEGWGDVQGHPEKLIAFIRAYQARVSFLYAHHPQLTVQDIDQLGVGTFLPPPSREQRMRAAFAAYTRRAGAEDAMDRSYARFRTVLGPLYGDEVIEKAANEAYGYFHQDRAKDPPGTGGGNDKAPMRAHAGTDPSGGNANVDRAPGA